MGLKNVSRVGTKKNLIIFFFCKKNKMLCILKGVAFQNP